MDFRPHHRYKTPSGLGGEFTAKYIGTFEGKLKFRIITPGFEQCWSLDRSEAEKRMTRVKRPRITRVKTTKNREQ